MCKNLFFNQQIQHNISTPTNISTLKYSERRAGEDLFTLTDLVMMTWCWSGEGVSPKFKWVSLRKFEYFSPVQESLTVIR